MHAASIGSAIARYATDRIANAANVAMFGAACVAVRALAVGTKVAGVAWVVLFAMTRGAEAARDEMVKGMRRGART